MNLCNYLFATLTAYLALFSNAHAQMFGHSTDQLTAGKLYATCNQPETANAQLRDLAAQTCALYFRGLTDGLWLMKEIEDSRGTPTGDVWVGCLPAASPLSTAEAEGDFELFLKDHPQAIGNSAALVATLGIMRAHPCP